jgi:serine/threonine protein kinase
MIAETEVVINTEVGEVRKRYLRNGSVLRLAREAFILRLLDDSSHTPKLKDVDFTEHTITTEYIAGRSFAEVFSVDKNWNASPQDWSEAGPLLAQYVAAEQSLVEEGVLYRDLSPGHLVFTDDHAVLVEHSESLVSSRASMRRWFLYDHRGEPATMAPEEFYGQETILTPRTATYRAAVMAHIALAGGLPFEPGAPYWRNRRKLLVATELPDSTRSTLRSALHTSPGERHADPAAFFNALKATYEDTV